MNEINHAVGGIQSIDYIGKILELFCDQSGSLSLKDIAHSLDESPAKIFRYLVSLNRIGLLNKTENNEYEVGDFALDLSFKALNELDPVEEACKTAKQINHDTGYGVAVSVWGALGPTVIKTYEPKESIYSKIRIGSVMALCTTSIGHTFAKYLPEHILQDALKYEELRHSGNKLNSKQANEFIKSIKNHKDQIITFMNDRPIPGLSSISIPVFSISEEIQFVITAFHHSHVLNDQQNPFEPYLLEKIQILSKTIGLK